MDDTNKQRHGELRAEITSKADSTDITRLDQQLADVNNQLSSATASIVDIKANLSHVTITHAAELKKLDEMIVTQHASGLLFDFVGRQVRGPRTTPIAQHPAHDCG
jgi:septal ring factor EnvC (AmiA/AmiB activator)